MIKYAATYIILAIVSAILGYGEFVGTLSIVAKVAFFLFIIIYVITLLRTGVVSRYQEE